MTLLITSWTQRKSFHHTSRRASHKLFCPTRATIPLSCSWESTWMPAGGFALAICAHCQQGVWGSPARGSRRRRLLSIVLCPSCESCVPHCQPCVSPLPALCVPGAIPVCPHCHPCIPAASPVSPLPALCAPCSIIWRRHKCQGMAVTVHQGVTACPRGCHPLGTDTHPFARS